ncbi:MAG TPA: lamin tail domain-containing protein [Pyrinomonadaceae bacterium]|nr:lamin tail domain-containing protein [Pyrinomonadaceae bacterium]
MINEIYTEGGLTGAAYLNDYVELYNASSNSCNLTNYSIQVATGNANNFPNVFGFTSGSIIPARGFYLIQFGSGGSNGIPLPSPDFSAATDLSTSGKVALVASTSSLTGNCASNLSGSIDFVGYGSTNCSKTSPAVSPTAASSIERITNGYNTNNNNVDFALRTASPRNTLSPTAAHVSISGQLQIDGRGVSSARIIMTNQLGENVSVRTNQFGYFYFSNINVGETYVLNVSSKSGSFFPIILNVQENVTDLHFELMQ